MIRFKENILSILIFITFTIFTITYLHTCLEKKKYPKLYKLEDKSEIASQKQLSILMDTITKGIEEPYASSYYSKPEIKILHRIYNKPRSYIFENLEDNLNNNKVWMQMPNNHNNVKVFCNDEIELTISNEQDYESNDILSISISWEKLGICRRNYIKHLS